jgi:ABC-2 type transport system ATP-binding protein
MDSIITIEHLTKNYNTFTAVDDISFQVKRGEIFAFL